MAINTAIGGTGTIVNTAYQYRLQTNVYIFRWYWY